MYGKMVARLEGRAAYCATTAKRRELDYGMDKNADEKPRGRTPKTLGFFVIFGFGRASRQLRAFKRRGGAVLVRFMNEYCQCFIG